MYLVFEIKVVVNQLYRREDSVAKMRIV